jgi:hypothetical protein
MYIAITTRRRIGTKEIITEPVGAFATHHAADFYGQQFVRLHHEESGAYRVEFLYAPEKDWQKPFQTEEAR